MKYSDSFDKNTKARATNESNLDPSRITLPSIVNQDLQSPRMKGINLRKDST